jgi:hypothetical protein
MGQVEHLASGGLRIPATFTRIGVFHYQEGGLWIGELRLPEEVFAAASLASLRGVPLTRLHPAGAVTRASWALVARGHVCDDVRVDGLHVRGHVVAAHPELCSDVESGALSELSCGYVSDCVEQPGEWQGVPYQRIQTGIRYDHVAVGPQDWARGGPTVRLALDGGVPAPAASSRAYFLPLTGGRFGRLETHYRAASRAGATRMSLQFLRQERAVEVGGKKYDLTKPDEIKAAVEAARVSNRRTDAIEPTAMAAVLDEVRGHLDVAQQAIVQLAADLVSTDVAMEAATSPEQLDAMTEERADCIGKARALAPTIDTKGKTIEQIQRSTLDALGHKTDGETAAYVRGAFNNATKGVTATFTRADMAALGGAGAQAVGAKTGTALSDAWKPKTGQNGRA